MTDKAKDVLAEAAELVLAKFPPKLVTITQDKTQLERLYRDDYEEVSLNAVLHQRFETGHGVVALSATMSDDQILALIKGACAWSKGKAFQVIPPRSGQS